MVYPFKGKLLSSKINELTGIYIKMDESQKYTAKLKKLDPLQIFAISFSI